MSAKSTQWWVDDLHDVCVEFQLDLSCLVDGELDESAAGRAIAHLEDCHLCRDFFDDVRQQVRAHRELADPAPLLDRYSTLLGEAANVDEEIETIDLVHRLTTIFYRLGKAYVLNELDPGFRTRIFEQAVQIGPEKNQGRGFVDGVLERGRGEVGGLDWSEARHLLNGKLERIESPLEKARRLLDEALAVDPTHEESQLYLAFLDAHEGRRLRAATAYRRIFRTAVDEANKAHAALQLGKLHAEEGEIKKAIACNRWILMSGLAADDDRFFFAHFNIGMYYADLRQPTRSVAAFRQLLDDHPNRVPEIADLFLRSPVTRAVIDHQPGFAVALVETCPELFAGDMDADADGVEGHFEEDPQ